MARVCNRQMTSASQQIHFQAPDMRGGSQRGRLSAEPSQQTDLFNAFMTLGSIRKHGKLLRIGVTRRVKGTNPHAYMQQLNSHGNNADTAT